MLGNRFDPQWEPIRRSMGFARRLAERVNLAAMTPLNTLASTQYCLADPGSEYLVLPAERRQGDGRLKRDSLQARRRMDGLHNRRISGGRDG